MIQQYIEKGAGNEIFSRKANVRVINKEHRTANTEGARADNLQ